MAKRAPAGEAAYNPLDQSLADSVIASRPSYQSAQDEFDHEPNRLIELGIRENKPDRLTAAKPVRGFSRAKRVLLTPEEERHIERLVDRLAEQLGSPLKFSHLMRACMSVLCHAEAEIIQQATMAKPVERPANGDAVALAQFEQCVAKLLSKALRDAPPIR
jgi:hypothetical protein